MSSFSLKWNLFRFSFHLSLICEMILWCCSIGFVGQIYILYTKEKWEATIMPPEPRLPGSCTVHCPEAVNQHLLVVTGQEWRGRVPLPEPRCGGREARVHSGTAPNTGWESWISCCSCVIAGGPSHSLDQVNFLDDFWPVPWYMGSF